jgi:hypothetical protein
MPVSLVKLPGAVMKTILFRCGTEFQSVDNIYVKNIYSGFIEGVADPKINQDIVADFVQDIRQRAWQGKPYLLFSDMQDNAHYPALPEYACAVNLRFAEPVHHPDCLMSAATLVWFQQQNPILHGFDLTELIRELHWKDVASDLSW